MSKAEAVPRADTGSLVEVGLDRLIESRHNPRKTFDEAALSELAASIKEHGIITPLLVRAVGNDGKYEILAGARRFRASIAAGIDSVPCRVVEAENDKAVELIVVENLQRENVHPLEEAEGFREILDLSNGDLAGLCARIGKPATFVSKRLSLLNLLDKGRKLFLRGQITEGHAIVLSRLQKADQKEAIEYVVAQAPSVGELRSWVESDLMLELARAPWDKRDATLYPKAGTCQECPKRTGSAKDLFDDIKGGDRCIDLSCWKVKMKAHIDRVEKSLRDQNHKVYGIWSAYRHPVPQGTLAADKWVEIGTKKSPLCEREARGIFLDGSQAGHFIAICPGFSDCKIHGGTGLHGKTPAEREETRKARLKDRVERESRARILRAVHKAQGVLSHGDKVALALHVLDRLWHHARMALCKTVELPMKKGQYGVDFKPVEKAIEGMSEAELSKFFVAACCANDLDPRTKGGTLDAFAARLKVGADAIRKAVKDELEKKSKRLPKQRTSKTAKKTSKVRKPKPSPEPEGADGPEEGDGGGDAEE